MRWFVKVLNRPPSSLKTLEIAFPEHASGGGPFLRTPIFKNLDPPQTIAHKSANYG